MTLDGNIRGISALSGTVSGRSSGGAVAIDTTLSVAGAAAEAKTVGDKSFIVREALQSGDDIRTLVNPGIYYKNGGVTVQNGVNNNMARVFVFHSYANTNGRVVIWADVTHRDIYFSMYTGASESNWSNWKKIASDADVSAIETAIYNGRSTSTVSLRVPGNYSTLNMNSFDILDIPNDCFTCASASKWRDSIPAEGLKTLIGNGVYWISHVNSRDNGTGIDRFEITGNDGRSSYVLYKPLNSDTWSYTDISSVKLDVDQGSGNAGKVMTVGNDGLLAPAEPAVRSFAQTSVGGHNVFNIGYTLSGPMGDMTTTGSVYPASETYRKDEVDAATADKLDKDQGSGNAGKVMTVGNDGELSPVTPDFYKKSETYSKSEVNQMIARAMIEIDPNVPAWAKAPSKPSYTASEVGALPSSTAIHNVPAGGTSGQFLVKASNADYDYTFVTLDTFDNATF